MRVAIVVPILNEIQILDVALRRLESALRPPEAGPAEIAEAGPYFEVVLTDAGSGDGSLDVARAFTQRQGWRLAESRLASPSVGRTVAAGLAEVSSECSAVLILPCDCWVPRESLLSFVKAIREGARCGGLEKRYDPATPLLDAYAWLQNRVRLRWSRNLVWTNGIFFDTRLLRDLEWPRDGFLEDVILSDRLKLEQGWVALRDPIHVSSRRYYPDRVLRRILVNLIILCLYRARIASPIRLRRLYQSLR